MRAKTIKRLNAGTVARYDGRLAKFGPGAAALGWGHERYQLKRFRDLLHALERDDLSGKTLLDVGCGLGDLRTFLRGEGIRLKGYVGIDINPSLIALARRRHPGCRLEVRDVLLSPFKRPVADTGVLLGVMNFKIRGQRKYAETLIERAFAAVRETLVVNVISDVHNEDYPREAFIHYYKPDQLLRFAQTLTPFCSLIHDYRGEPQHELMLVLRKKAFKT
jgi:SAM-dependent methyltransferase